jgi:hypothetical protein
MFSRTCTAVTGGKIIRKELEIGERRMAKRRGFIWDFAARKPGNFFRNEKSQARAEPPIRTTRNRRPNGKTPPLRYHEEEREDLDIKAGRVQHSSRDERR